MTDRFQEAARVAEQSMAHAGFTERSQADFILEAFASIRAEYEALRELERGQRLERESDHAFSEEGDLGKAIRIQTKALDKLDALRGKEGR